MNLNEIDIETLFANLELVDTESHEAFTTFLVEQGLDNLSKNQKTKLFKLATATTFRCLSCVEVYETITSFRKHLKQEKHFYGQGKYRLVKRRLIKRIQVRSNDPNLPDVDEHSEAELSNVEKLAFRSLFDRNESEITRAESETLENIVFLGWNMKYL